MKTDTGRNLYKRGSLSIEAALVLPLFLFAMICVISLSALLMFQMRLKEALHEETKKYVIRDISGADSSFDLMKNEILTYVGDYILKIAPIAGEPDFHMEKYSGEIIVISVEYEAELYYDLFGLFHHRFVQKNLQHDFRGYKRGLHGVNPDDNEEEYVYITPNSEVYHLSRECSHIRLNISEISSEAVKNSRNSDGSKYKSCEHCHSRLTDGHIYITPDGDKFHNSLGCSGLKRNVIAIPISEINGRRCCSRCGG